MVAVLCGLLVGAALGLTGGGGSIFAVPLLVYVVGVPMRDAVQISLAAVAASAAFGAFAAWRTGLVEIRAAFIFAAGGMLAAPAGVRLSQFVAEDVSVLAFALLMLLVAILLWFRANHDPQQAAVVRAGLDPSEATRGQPICRFNADQQLVLTAPCSALLAASGIGTGVLSGFLGVGGGFVIVPALTIISQMSIHRAVATSLLVITMIGTAGVGSAWMEGQRLPLLTTSCFLLGGIGGMGIGRTLSARIAGATLQKLFAAAISVVGLAMLVVTWRG